MAVPNDPSPNDPLAERRHRRAACLADALRFQLDVCREIDGLAAVVVSDELGFCVAHSGGEGEHAELAAQLPILAGPRGAEAANQREGSGASPLVVTTFSAAGATLHAGAVPGRRAGDRPPTAAALARVAGGFSRMLAE